MLKKISNNWWMFALRGLVAVIFGVLALVRYDQAGQGLVLVFGAFALVNGIITLFAGISSAPYFDQWWALLLEGIAGIIVGLMAIFMPDITTTALIYMIGIWALILGIFQIVTAVKFRKVLEDEWMLVLGGILSIICGVLMFVFPEEGAVSLVWVIGIYAIIFGITEIVFGFRLRDMKGDVEKVIETVTRNGPGSGTRTGFGPGTGTGTGSATGTGTGTSTGTGTGSGSGTDTGTGSDV